MGAPLIYVTGPDGCGKTSTCKSIGKILKKRGQKYKHVYSIKRNVIKYLIFALRRKLHGKTDPTDNKFSSDPSKRTFRFVLTEDIFDRDDGTFLWRLRKFFTLLITIFDVFLNNLVIKYWQFKGNVVLVETSPYDIFLKYHMPRFKLVEIIFARLLPKPTIGVVLDAEPQKIFDRKPELTVEELESYYSRLEVLLVDAHVADRFHKVNSDKGLEHSLNEVEALLNRELFDCIDNQTL
jgi:Cdc6-like AAA superfamily ATPase